jgi:hypothetical protein
VLDADTYVARSKRPQGGGDNRVIEFHLHEDTGVTTVLGDSIAAPELRA